MRRNKSDVPKQSSFFKEKYQCKHFKIISIFFSDYSFKFFKIFKIIIINYGFRVKVKHSDLALF